MHRPTPQTEEDELMNLVAEAAWLTGKAYLLTGRVPLAINERIMNGDLDFNVMAAADVAAICRAIREEVPALAEAAP